MASIMSGLGPFAGLAENGVNLSAELLDPDVTFTSTEALGGGWLIVAGLLAEDRVSILTQGDGTGQIGFDGGTVRYGGVAIGTAAGGVGADFTVTFNAAATAAAVDALIQRLSYANPSDTPTATRRLTLDVLDAAGAHLLPHFAALTGTANPLDGIDVGIRSAPAITDLNEVGWKSAPAFVDLDGDGRLDLVSGELDGTLLVWRNTTDGFVPLAAGDNPFSGIDVGTMSSPAFEDLDADGRRDLVVGNWDGTLSAWRNTVDGFVALAGAANPFDGINVGQFSTPSFVDLDGDGRRDLVAGSSAGTLLVWRNTETGFVALTGTANPLDGIAASAMSAPSFVDLDQDGRLDLVLGANASRASFYRNIFPANGYWWLPNATTGGALLAWRNTADGFVPLAGAENPFAGLDLGGFAMPAFVDLDGDGRLDLVSGDGEGGFRTWRNTEAAITVTVTPENDRPLITSPATVRFAENGAGIAYQMVATDADGPLPLTYWLAPAGGQFVVSPDGSVQVEVLPGYWGPGTGGGDDTALFTIDAATGALRFVQAPDFESPRDLDGDNVYKVAVAVSDGTGLYAPGATSVVFLSITVTDVQGPGTLTGLSQGIAFRENTVNAAPQLLDTDVVFTRGDSLAGGRLVVSGLLAEDRITVLGEGTGDGQIGFDGSAVTYGGVLIGTATGGVGGDFTVTFTSAVTGAAVDALIQRLGYGNASDAPTLARDLSIDVIDGRGLHLAATATPQFTALTGADNPFDGIGILRYGTPTFVDLNADGRLDLVAGSVNGRLLTAYNTGSGFAAVAFSENPLRLINAGATSAPAFVDLDGDGRLDLVSGNNYGRLLAWRNTGSGFDPLAFGANPFIDIRAGYVSKPAFVDLDGDGRLDLVVGNDDGVLLAWHNTGSGYVALTGAANPFDGIDVGSSSAPAFVDLDGDGRLDLVSGTTLGTLLAWRNTGSGFTALAGAANPFDGIDVGQFSAPSFVDLDGDGRLDLVSASAADGAGGPLVAWRNTTPVPSITVSVLPEIDRPVITSPSAVSFAENGTGIAYQGAATTPDGPGTSNTWVLDGADAALFSIDPATGAVRFLAAPDYEVPRDAGGDNVYDITVLALGGGSGLGLSEKAVTITVTDVQGPGTLTGLGPAIAFAENTVNAAPQLLDADVLFTPGDSLVNGRLVVSGLLAEDRITVLGEGTGAGQIGFDGIAVTYGGVTIGTATGGVGGDFTVVFTGAVTGAAVDALIQRLGYGNASDRPFPIRTLMLDVMDAQGDALAAPATIAVAVNGENDRPVITSPATARFAENGTGVVYQAQFTDTDGPGYFPPWLLVGTDGQLFSVDATGAVRFRATPDFETPRDFNGDNVYEIELRVTDGIGNGYQNVTITVTDVPETATLTGLAPAVTFLENTVNAAPQLLDADVVFTAGDSLAGGRLIVSGLLAEDRVSLLAQGNAAGQIGFDGTTVTFGGTAIGTATGGIGGDFTVAFTSAVTGAAVDALIQRLAYGNASDTPTATRDLGIDVIDGRGMHLAATPMPRFTVLGGADNPFLDVPFNFRSKPAFTDLDGDGRLDLVLGNSDGTLLAMRNTGDSFTLLTGADNPLAGIGAGSLSAPAFTDLDGDGRLDLVLGNSDGTLLAWRNTGGGFAALTGAANPFDGMDVGDQSAPAFTDLDGDGRLDLVVGTVDGTLLAWRNTGSGFAALTGTANPFDGIDVGGTSTPSFVDLDGDGRVDLVVGTGFGELQTWRNTGTGFTALTGAANPLNGVNVRGAAAPAFVDLDGDGRLDLVVGNRYGTLPTWCNTTPVPSITVVVDGENDPPVITSPSAVSFAENGTGVAYQAQRTDPDGSASPLSWLLFGPDGPLFTVDAAGAVRFRAAPDFEAPRDANGPTPNGDNVYHIQLLASDGPSSVLQDVTITVTDVPETATLTGLAPAVTFLENTVNAAPQLLDADVVFTPGDSLAGGRLVVSGLLAEDRVTLLTQGIGAGQIGFDGTTVTYGGTPIGTATGGVGGDFTVTFNAAATGASVNALIQRLGYSNASDAPTATRRLLLDVVDAQGDSLATPPGITATVTPQDDPFTGPRVHALAPLPEDTTRILTIADLLQGWSDPDSDGLVVQALEVISGNPGTLLDRGDGSWGFTPAPNDTGDVVFLFDVTDGLLVRTATATLDLTPVNDAPVGTVALTAMATQLTVAAALTDVDGLGPITLQWQALRGGVWTDIAGATGPNLTPGAGLSGDQVRAVARYTDGAGTVEAVASDGIASIGRAGADVLSGGTAPGALFGRGGHDSVTGGAGAETLSGAAGNDSASGNDGADSIDGGSGNDSLAGGTGDDTLVGGAGQDLLSGGADADVFRFLGRTHGGDTILDFTPSIDVIEVLGEAFGALVEGPLPAARFSLGAPVGKVAQFVYDGATGALSFDLDGTGARAAVVLATLTGAPTLTASDMVVIA